MKVTKTAPRWATELVTQVCADYKRSKPVKFQWYNTKHKHTSGHASYYGRKIHISAGTDGWEHNPVLLHELSHHIVSKTRRGKKRGHDIKFWSLFWELSEQYGNVELSYKRDVELARKWRPESRAKALVAYDRRPIEKAPAITEAN